MPPHWMQIFYIGENYFPSALDIAFDCDSNDILGMLSKCDIKFGYNEVFKKACLKCDIEKIEILLDNDKENEIQPNRDEFCSFIEAANMKRISATQNIFYSTDSFLPSKCVHLLNTIMFISFRTHKLGTRE